MPSVQIINNMNDISIGNDWTPAKKFNSEGRLVNRYGESAPISDYNGPTYRIIKKWEAPFSCCERGLRGLLGMVLVVCTLGLALIFEKTRQLFSKTNKSIRFAIPARETGD